MKRVAITGAAGFVGRNLLRTLADADEVETLALTRHSPTRVLQASLADADVLVHLAGANRPAHDDEFTTTNVDYSRELSDILSANNPRCSIIFSSSVQAINDSPYGMSKRSAEMIWSAHAERTGSSVHLLRLSNVFGAGCRPNYNSAVATFAHNIAHGLPIVVSDPLREVPLVYVDDVTLAIAQMIADHDDDREKVRFPDVGPVRRRTLGEIVTLLESFRDARNAGHEPHLRDDFAQQLLATYLSYEPARSAMRP